MLIKSYGSAVFGVEAQVITVEVSVSIGIKYYMVGLPDISVRESQQRIASAFAISGYRFPGKKIVINMAPADIRKEGSAYDLPIAIAILAASEQIAISDLSDCVMMGELSLDGSIRPTCGVISIVLEAKRKNFKRAIIPYDNRDEASFIDGIDIFAVEKLSDVISVLTNVEDATPLPLAKFDTKDIEDISDDFSDVKGQGAVKRAMEIAAAGGHNILLIGPPGSGKTMLSQRFRGILPPLTRDEALETTKIYSVANGVPGTGVVTERPFRSPHHTISAAALIGGGAYPKPGEISLAHNGVLFLDELPEFNRSVLEVLRQPMESNLITIARAKYCVTYPADFTLVASMNPCPCGFYTHPQKECYCSPVAIKNYLGRISGPLLDRIDIQLEVQPVDYSDLTSSKIEETSRSIKERVSMVHQTQIKRDKKGGLNSLRCYTPDKRGGELLKSAMDKLGLSARAYTKILKIARTIADLEQSEEVASSHIAEAIQYRILDREDWGS